MEAVHLGFAVQRGACVVQVEYIVEHGILALMHGFDVVIIGHGVCWHVRHVAEVVAFLLLDPALIRGLVAPAHLEYNFVVLALMIEQCTAEESRALQPCLLGPKQVLGLLSRYLWTVPTDTDEPVVLICTEC